MNLLLAIVSGLLLVAVFPRFDWTWLAPFALAPLLIACARETNWKHRFLEGWAAGFLFWFSICTWIQFVLEVHGGLGKWGGWGTFLLFALIKGAYTGVFAVLAGRLMNRSWAIPAIAALWTGFEFSHGSLGIAWIGLGFSWLQLGNAAVDMPVLPRLGPLVGVWGITFIFVMLNCAVALLVLRRPRGNFAPLLAIPVLLLLPAIPEPATAENAVQVVQPNVDLATNWTGQTFNALLDRLKQLSLAADAPLIVWPEAPAPFYPEREPFGEYFASVARDAGANYLMGAVSFTSDGSPLNSAFLFNPQGGIVGRYDKIELVPFGEYVPPAFSWVNQISGESGAFTPGTQIVTFPVNGHTIGTFICYESAFPSLVRRFAAQGAEVLINISNDGYFGDSAAREQHLNLVRMRAIENRRWILRSTNNGITVMIAPSGRITERMAEYQETADTMYFNYESSQTLYTRFGDWFAWLCLVLGLTVCAIPVPREPLRV